MVVTWDTPLGAEQGWEFLGQKVGSEQGKQEQLSLPWQHPALTFPCSLYSCTWSSRAT